MNTVDQIYRAQNAFFVLMFILISVAVFAIASILVEHIKKRKNRKDHER